MEENTIKIKPPWTRYRILLLSIIQYLELNENHRGEFKVFFYRSIQTSVWDKGVSEWLIKMEQSQLISFDNLDCIAMFFEASEGELSVNMLLKIREFQQWMRILQLLVANRPPDEWLSPPIQRYSIKISRELHDWFHRWRNKIRGTSNLEWNQIYEIYSSAAQRIANTIEAITIADFLMEELSGWFLTKTDHELNNFFEKSLIRLNLTSGV